MWQVVSCLEECPDLRLGTMTADDIADMQAAVAAPKDKAAEEAEDEASAQVWGYIHVHALMQTCDSVSSVSLA